MKKIILPLIINAIYSMLGWLLCIAQIGSAMIVDYNWCLVLTLSVLHLLVGITANIYVYSSLKKKNAETSKINIRLLKIDCAIIAFPYLLLLLSAIVGWL